MVRVLENLDRLGYATACYSDRIKKDDLTHRIAAAATGGRDVIGMSDDRLAEQIKADGVDILFDLAGHTANHRLLVFARNQPRSRSPGSVMREQPVWTRWTFCWPIT